MFRFGDPGGRMYTVAGTSQANILAHWTSSSAISTWSVSAGSGRASGSALACTSPGDGRLLRTLGPQQTWGVAFAFKTVLANTSVPTIAGFLDASTSQMEVRINPDMTLSVTRGGTVLGTSSLALATNSYAHIEFKVKIDPTVGTYEVRVNGVTQITGTSANTRASSNSTANQVFIGPSIGTSGTLLFDDVIFWDGQATDANGFADIHDFIGDCGLAWLLPTGAGTTTQFTPDTGSNYARVNEATPDGDTSYAESATVSNIDTYATADLAGTITSVKSVAVAHYAKKTDVGSRGMKAELRSAGANAAHATEIALGNSYQYYLSVFGQDPNNGSAANWTPTSVNALEIGQQVSS